MAFVIHSDEQHRFYYQMETTFGTPVALSSTSMKELVIEKGQFVDLGIVKSPLNQNRTSRVRTLTDVFNDNFSGPVGLQFTTLCTRDRIADLLYLVTQNRVSQGGATAYQKVFRQHASQPDFTVNTGAFATGVWKSPVSSKHIQLTSGILKELTLTWDKSGVGDANLVRASGLWLFKAFTEPALFTGSGSVQDPTLAFRAHAFALNFSSLGINPANWSRMSITIRNNAVGVDRNSSGNPFTFFLNPGESGLTLTCEVWYTTTYAGILTHLQGNTSFAFNLSTGTTGATGFFDLTGNGIYVPPTGPAIVDNQMRLPFEVALGNTADGATDALDIAIADGISQT